MNSILKKGMLPVAVAIAMLGVIGAFGGNTRSAEAIQGDICGIYVGDEDSALSPVANFDGQGNDVYVVAPDTTYGLVFRVQDIIGGWLANIAFDDTIVAPETEDDSFDISFAGILPGPNVHVEVDSETGSARITSQAQAYSFSDGDDVSIGGYTVDDLWLVPNVTHVLINPGVISQVTQSYSPRFFNNSSGFVLDNINSWLENHAGMYPFANSAADVCGSTGCGAFDEYFSDDELTGFDPDDATDDGGEITIGTVYPCDDAWGYVDFECIESGYFHIDLRTSDIQWGAMNDLLLPLIEEVLEDIDSPLPPFITPQDILEEILYWNLDPARTGYSAKFFCTGYADTATIASQRATVETQPTNVAPAGFGTSVITVTVLDQDGDRIDGALVHFTTDNCTFQGGADISPAGGGASVHTSSDTDTTSDTNFIANNPLQAYAGTAEATLDCTTSAGKAGVANVTAIVERPGADITLKVAVNVVGPVSANGLTLTLAPDELECGETLLASVTAVDAEGNPISDGTTIYFTTDTSSGVVGGVEGAQGMVYSEGGKASVLIATDPGNPGVHTVIAYVVNNAGTPMAQTSATYTCEGAVAPVVPTVNPPGTGTGTGSITPPNTGDAGLASGNGSSLFVLAGAVAFVLAGLASVRFARN